MIAREGVKAAADGQFILKGQLRASVSLQPQLWALGVGTSKAHLDVLAVVATGRQLDASECDGALQRNLDGRLLHAVLSIETRGPGDGATAEVALY